MTDLITKLKDLERVTGREWSISLFSNGTMSLWDNYLFEGYSCKDAQDCREQMYRIVLEHRPKKSIDFDKIHKKLDEFLYDDQGNKYYKKTK